MNELGKKLRELRGNMSLRDAAEKTGLSHSYISDIEKGIRRGTKTPINPSPDALKRLAKAYDYPYEKLMQAAGYIDKNGLPALNDKDKKDVAKDLENILSNLKGDNALAFNGEPMDDITRQLVAEAIESNLKMAKQLAKKKFTPKNKRKWE